MSEQLLEVIADLNRMSVQKVSVVAGLHCRKLQRSSYRSTRWPFSGWESTNSH